MGRRSDHSRAELTELILTAGSGLVAETGLSGFSAREVARRIGYSIGTIHNVFGSADRLLIAINTRSFGLWAAQLRQRLAGADDRIAALVEGYFVFATAHPNLWSAIYDHRLAGRDDLPDAAQQARVALIKIVEEEVSSALGRPFDDRIAALALSLVAIVHGHCAFAVGGAWSLLGGDAPEAAALARVREALTAGA